MHIIYIQIIEGGKSFYIFSHTYIYVIYKYIYIFIYICNTYITYNTYIN